VHASTIASGSASVVRATADLICGFLRNRPPARESRRPIRLGPDAAVDPLRDPVHDDTYEGGEVMRRILIATDGSDGGRHAVETGTELAHEVGAAATIVFVRRPLPTVVGDPCGQVELCAGFMREARAAVAQALQQASKLGVEAESEILMGDAADEILRLASSKEADLIVLGSRDHWPTTAAFLGSVSRDVVCRADRPVLIAHGAAQKSRAA